MKVLGVKSTTYNSWNENRNHVQSMTTIEEETTENDNYIEMQNNNANTQNKLNQPLLSIRT